MTKPAELAEAELIDMLARRYSVHPDVILDGDADVLRRVALLMLAAPQASAPVADDRGNQFMIEP